MKNYYEIEFAKLEQLNDDYITTPDRMFICIIAEFEPSFEDVEEFCKEDMKNCGYDCVVDINQLSYEEAHQMYDLRNELNFPVLKQKNFETTNNNLTIKLSNGKEIVAQLCNYDDNHSEIAICIQENGIAVQDLCIIRPHEDEQCNPVGNDIDCLVWSDETLEYYTHKFVISHYEEEDC